MTDAEDDDTDTILHSAETALEWRAAGLPVLGTRATPEQCEAADFLICAPVRRGTIFPDSLIAACSQCNEPVFYRPHAPKAPIKICVPCASATISKAKGRA